MSEGRVQCDVHGESWATLVCRHLSVGEGRGFHWSTEHLDDRWPDAWCDACDATLDGDGAWSEANQPEVEVLCRGCYEAARERNYRVPAALSEQDWGPLVAAACERARERQELANGQFRFGEKRRWHYDSDSRTMRFFDAPGGEAVVADVLVTGSFSTNTNTWMWAWGNEGYPDDERIALLPVRVFGEVRRFPKLGEAYWPGEEVDAWEVTQVAAELLGAEAIYRMPQEHMMVFLLLYDLRVES